MGYKNIEQKREYQLRWINERRDSWLKENGPCAKCKTWINLQVDHIDPKLKAMEPAAIWSRKEEVRNKELAKCQVLCEDCHKEKTKENKEYNYGEKHPKSILTNSKVTWARSEFLKGKSFKEIAEVLQISQDTARQAIRKGWLHLEIGPILYK